MDGGVSFFLPGKADVGNKQVIIYATPTKVVDPPQPIMMAANVVAEMMKLYGQLWLPFFFGSSK